MAEDERGKKVRDKKSWWYAYSFQSHIYNTSYLLSDMLKIHKQGWCICSVVSRYESKPSDYSSQFFFSSSYQWPLLFQCRLSPGKCSFLSQNLEMDNIPLINIVDFHSFLWGEMYRRWIGKRQLAVWRLIVLKAVVCQEQSALSSSSMMQRVT